MSRAMGRARLSLGVIQLRHLFYFELGEQMSVDKVNEGTV
jgi:hypothetical protein